MELDQIVIGMPKIELHAHLNGSISVDILKKYDSSLESELNLSLNNIKSLDWCFEMFRRVHKVVRTPQILFDITCDVIKSFADDNVIYLELRTTPKAIHDIKSKKIYLQTVLDAILHSQRLYKIVVKLLVSIDRKLGLKEGEENLELGLQLSQVSKYENLIVGIDVSGYPEIGTTDNFLPILLKAREEGRFKISCHMPEILDNEGSLQILNSLPHRIGHGMYLHPSLGGTSHLWEIVKNNNIPIEVCLTSNLISGVSNPSSLKNYVNLLADERMDFVICTDDCGVFSTTLTKEYQLFISYLNEKISLNRIKELVLKSIEFSFSSSSEKEELRKILNQYFINFNLCS